jgi:hypothetical protein
MGGNITDINILTDTFEVIPDCEDTDSSAAPSALEHGAHIPLDHRTFLQWTSRWGSMQRESGSASFGIKRLGLLHQLVPCSRNGQRWSAYLRQQPLVHHWCHSSWRAGPQTKKKSLGCKLESATPCRVIVSFASYAITVSCPSLVACACTSAKLANSE